MASLRRLRAAWRAAISVLVLVAVGSCSASDGVVGRPPSRTLQQPISDPTSGRVWLPIVEGGRAVERAELAFDPPRGLYRSPVDIRLTTDAPATTIRYTVDGNLPTARHGHVYDAPVRVERPTVIRAVAIRGDRIISDVATRSYIVPEGLAEQGARPPGLPSTWGVYAESHLEGREVPADYAMDPDVISDPRHRSAVLEGLRSLPTLSLSTAPDAFFHPESGIYIHPRGKGRAWERSVHAEWIPVPGSGEAAFDIQCGIRIAGNASRKHVATPKKSFSLRFNRRHGPARLEYPLFGRSEVESFDTLRLRAVFNDSFLYVPERAQYLRDQWARESQAEMGMLAARGRFAHVYLNGLYWGMYNITEEPTAAFMADHRGGDEEDWDVIEPQVEGEEGVEDGDRTAFDRLVAARDIAGPDGLAEIERLLDVEAYIDFTLLQMFIGNAEFADNWRAARRRDVGDGPGFVFFAWDFENGLDLLPPLHRFYAPKERIDVADTFGIEGLHGRLRREPAYRRRFGDRAQFHLGPGGALSRERAVERYRRLAAAVDPGIAAESARWGDAPLRPLPDAHGHEAWEAFWDRNGTGHAQTREDEWRPEAQRLTGSFIPSRPQSLLDQLCREDLYPRVVAPVIRPTAWNEATGLPTHVSFVPETGARAIRCSGARRGTTWYTLDGVDPRTDEGWIAPSARPAVGGVPLPRESGIVRIMARARSGASWSALAEETIGMPRVVIDEIHYHPPEPDQRLEFVELHNLEPVTVDLGGWRLRGVGLEIAGGTLLEPGGRMVFARDPDALKAAHGVTVPVLSFPGRLANDGEHLALETPDGHTVSEVMYRDDRGWPLGPDGRGYSLVRARWSSDSDAARDPDDWRASRALGGSPGLEEPPAQGRVWINEVLADAPRDRRALELFNPGVEALAVGGWPLLHEPDGAPVGHLPRGLSIPGGGHVVVATRSLRSAEGSESGRDILDPLGGTLYLQALHRGAPTGDLRGVEYGPHAGGVTWGRHRTQAGLHFVAQSDPTLGRSPGEGRPRAAISTGTRNAKPYVGPVVISELRIRPPLRPGWDEADDEHVVLYNRTDRTIRLSRRGSESSDPGPYGLVDGIQYAFGRDDVIAPKSQVIISGGSPSAFRMRHDIPADIPVLGPFEGRLDDEGERVVLARWQSTGDGSGDAAWVTIDSVYYDTREPWPRAVTDGTGSSLYRVDRARFGGDPLAWVALRPSARFLRSITATEGAVSGGASAPAMVDGLPPFTR